MILTQGQRTGSCPDVNYNRLVLREHLQFRPGDDAEMSAALPASPAVFLLRGLDAASEPYASKTANLRRRLLRLLSPPEERSKRLNLRERVRSIEYTPTGSDFESGFLLYKILRNVFPQTYSDRLRFVLLRWSRCIWRTNFLELRSQPGLGALLVRTFTTAHFWPASPPINF